MIVSWESRTKKIQVMNSLHQWKYFFPTKYLQWPDRLLCSDFWCNKTFCFLPTVRHNAPTLTFMWPSFSLQSVMPKLAIKFSIHFSKRHGEIVLQKCLRALKIQCQHLLFLVTNAYYCVTTEILHVTCNHGIPTLFRYVFKVLFKSQFKEHHHYCFFPPLFHLSPPHLELFVWYRYRFYCFFFFSSLLMSARGVTMVTKRPPERITNP